MVFLTHIAIWNMFKGISRGGIDTRTEETHYVDELFAEVVT